MKLSEHFKIPIGVAVNKWDINEEMTHNIEQMTAEKGIEIFGRVRYDKVVTDAMVNEVSMVEYTDSGASIDIKVLWNNVYKKLEELPEKEK